MLVGVLRCIVGMLVDKVISIQGGALGNYVLE